MKSLHSRILCGLMLLAFVLLAGCARDMEDLKDWVARVKSRQPPPIEPLPEFEPYEKFTYSAYNLRSPFNPGRSPVSKVARQACPEPERPMQPLEAYSLDALAMVGTFTRGGQTWALVKDPKGVVHRVKKGDYMGRDYGRVTIITPTQVTVVERIENNTGRCIKRKATLALDS